MREGLSGRRQRRLRVLRGEARRIEADLAPAERAAAEEQPEPAPDELDLFFWELERRLDDPAAAVGQDRREWEREQFDDVLELRAAAAPDAGSGSGPGAVEFTTSRGRYRVTLLPAEEGGEWLLVVHDSGASEGRIVVFDDHGVILRATLRQGTASGRIMRPIGDLARVRFRTETRVE